MKCKKSIFNNLFFFSKVLKPLILKMQFFNIDAKFKIYNRYEIGVT